MNSSDNAREAIARRLSLARQQAGLSQGQVAKMLEMHRPTISEIEAGRRRVAVDELFHFAEVYGVEVAWLTSGEQLNEADDRVALAARELSKLKPDDLDRVMSLLKTLKQHPGESQ